MTGPKITKLPRPRDLGAASAQAQRLFGGVPGGLVLIGGVALQAFGHERATKDVDFAVTRAGAAEAERLAREQGMEVTPLRIGGVSIALGSVSVDLVDRRFEVEPLFLEAMEAARTAGTRVEVEDGLEVPVVPLEYLVALKVVPMRPQDEADLAYLLAEPRLDYPMAREIVRRNLGGVVARFLDRLARLAGRADVRPDYDS
jgi:hypothetical protein